MHEDPQHRGSAHDDGGRTVTLGLLFTRTPQGLVAAGLGLGFVNTAAAAGRGFVRVPAFSEVDRMPVWIATHKEVHTNRRIRVIADALAEGLAAALASHTTPAQSS